MKYYGRIVTVLGLGILSISLLTAMHGNNDPIDEPQENNAILNKNELYGEWVAPIPGNDRDIQGFALHNDGTARSINMATLNYQLWHVNNDKLILTAQSFGNGNTLASQEIFTIDSLRGNRLYLTNGNKPLVYWRVK
ncbi:MAG TPA: hypothetical protein DDX98_11295 [Bacteroidales bacterium]|jgi:hypothetical protein|nr:hypothetical protein [Bacteroidales bacterium]